MTNKNLFFLLTFACAMPVCALEETQKIAVPIYLIPEYMNRNVNFFKDWETIKAAVFAKKGEAFAQQFNAQYPAPSDDGVRALADQFDECNTYKTWLKTFPRQLPIMINNKWYLLFEGRMTDIIIAYKLK